MPQSLANGGCKNCGMTASPDAIQRMIDATNREDTDAFVASFTADAFLSDRG